jgi:hypothetical protein
VDRTETELTDIQRWRSWIEVVPAIKVAWLALDALWDHVL